MINSGLGDLAARGEAVAVAMAGAGFVGRGLAHQIRLTPGMDLVMVVNRSPDAGVAAMAAAGHDPADVVVSSDPEEVAGLVERGIPVVTTNPLSLRTATFVDVAVEATGDVEYGALVALAAIAGGTHVVTLNFETDATVGALLTRLAAREGVVYAGSDGDQPGVMVRMMDYVAGLGLDVVAAVNCKGFLDTHATPESIRPWAERQGTSPKMTTAFTDGTKMQVENCCVANATGLVPERRGMHGVTTTLAEALDDFSVTLGGTGVVEYTLGGDFGGGIFVIGGGAHPELAAPYLKYLKMGDGPWYLFFRPWHLVQFETPITIAEVALHGHALLAPRPTPIAQVVTIAKRDLPPGTRPDGVGGFDVRGEVDLLERSEGLVPVGIVDRGTITSAVADDEPVPVHAFAPDDSPIVRLWRHQGEVVGGADLLAADDLLEWWPR